MIDNIHRFVYRLSLSRRHRRTQQTPKLGAEKGGYDNVSSATGESEFLLFSKINQVNLLHSALAMLTVRLYRTARQKIS